MKISEMFELSFCINLDERTDRWEESKKEFEKINHLPERFSAIKHDNPSFGCFYSHLVILNRAVSENKNVLIFEDDVEFIQDDTLSIIESALEELSNMEWDMLYLGGNILKPFYQVTDHLARLSHCQSTHAYAVNKNFLPTLEEYLRKNVYIIDVMYAEGVIPYTNSYIVYPMIAIQRSSYSDIEKREMTYDIPLERYNKFFVPKGITNE